MQVFLGIGSNLGNRLAYLKNAIAEIQTNGILLIKSSSVYETAPWGYAQQPNFYNCVIEINVPHRALEDLLFIFQGIENHYQRDREFRYGPRTLDIDILCCGETQLCTERLSIPHPRIAERAFVLKPWSEIAPVFRLPGSHITIQEMLDRLPAEDMPVVAAALELFPT